MKRVIAYVFLTIILPIASKAQHVSPLYKDSIQMKWVDEKMIPYYPLGCLRAPEQEASK